ncbi:hypothetical protein [Polaromonas sp.]|uniref:hypothetical protein n=1 Tax=Polaromonas sp. TaxID=1869339 RepID=UPI00356AABCA
MSNISMKILMSLALLSALTSCAAQDNRQMYAKASALTKLSAAVEATVLYRNPSPTLSDDELLKLVAANDPTLLKEFDGFKVRVLRESQGVVLLVCKTKADLALLEDASCTAKLDRHHWRDSAKNLCEFTLKTVEVCPP